MDDFNLKISIPSDDDGFIMLKCHKCGEHFKLTADDIESDELLDIYCPLCGLTSDDFFDDDVENLALAKATNQIEDLLLREMENFGKKNKSSMFSIKTSKTSNEVYEKKLSTIPDDMNVYTTPCCNKDIKVRALLRFTGIYCSFCGGICSADNKG